MTGMAESGVLYQLSASTEEQTSREWLTEHSRDVAARQTGYNDNLQLASSSLKLDKLETRVNHMMLVLAHSREVAGHNFMRGSLTHVPIE